MSTYPKPVQRNYQVEAADAYLTIDKLCALITLPTCGGKTLMCASILDRFAGRRCLFLAHTDELVKEAGT